MSTYTREQVEQLLPAVWDSGFAYGMANPTEPDPDMPRATVDPAHAGTIYAHLADIHTGWKHAHLSHAERRALIMRYGLDWPQKFIARHEHITASTISERITGAVGRIVNTLNGDPGEEPDSAS